MSTQIEQPGNYEFAAQPQAIGAKGKYRDDSNPAGNGFLREKSKIQKTGGFQQTEGASYANFYDPLDEEGVDESQIEPDYYVDRPPSPEFKPKEDGVDVETQIEDYELFDYRLEVEPILQVLVGKTVDQARMELIEEFEQAELKKHKAAYEIKRNAELMVTQRMEAAYVRRQEEKERRNWQHKLHRDQEKLAHQKLISRLLIKRALGDVKGKTLNDLENQGLLRDEMIFKLRANVLPWILNSTIDIQNSQHASEFYLERIAEAVQTEIQALHSCNLQKESQRRNLIQQDRERLRLKKEERKRKKELWKQKNLLNSERQLILDRINETIINKAERIDNPKDCDFVDITGDNRRSNYQQKAMTVGGILGQLWIAIESLSLQPGSEGSISAELIKELIEINLRDLKHGISVKLSSSEFEFYENQIKLLTEANTDEDLNTHRENFVNALLERQSTIISQNPSLQFISGILGQQNTFATNSFREILRVLFEHLSKNIKPDPHVEGSSDRVDERNLHAKIKIVLENSEDIIQNSNTILRIRTPFLSAEEMQLKREQDLAKQSAQEVNQITPNTEEETGTVEGENLTDQKVIQQQEENKENEVEETNKEIQEECKYDEFVEIFNGEGYDRQYAQNMSTSERISLSDDFVGGFNLWSLDNCHILLLDERTNYFVQQLLLKQIKELGGLKQELDTELFAQLFTNIQAKFFENFVPLISHQKQSEIPIFDIDFTFKNTNE